MKGQLTAIGGKLGDKVAVVAFGGAGDVLHGKIEVQQLGMGVRIRVCFQPVLQRGLHSPQRREQCGGQFPEKHRAFPGKDRLRQFQCRRIGGSGQKAGLGGFFRRGFQCSTPGCQLSAEFSRLQKGLVSLAQGGFQGTFALAEGALCVGQAVFGKAGGVHRPGTVRQVVRLVNEEQPVAGSIKEPLQMHHRVEQVVVVANDHIAPLAQIQPQLKRAHRELPGGVGQSGTVKAAGAVQQGGQCVLHPAVVTIGERAQLRQTGRAALGVRVQADLFLGGQGHAAQRKAGVRCPQPGNGVLGGGLGRVAGGEVKELFTAAFAHGPQGGKDGAHGLADSGGCLAEQPGAALVVGVLSGAAGAVYFARQCPLAGAVFSKRKPQCGKAFGAPDTPVQLALRPGGILLQEPAQEGVQFFSGKVPHEADDLVGVDLIIGQPHVDFGKALLVGINGGIHHALRPVAGVHLLGDLLKGDGRGLDLVDDGGAVLVRKNTVGPAFQRESDAVRFPFGREEHLGLVALSGGFLQPAVDAGTFQRAVKPCKTAVDAAGAQQKFHQLPDGKMDGGHRVHFLLDENASCAECSRVGQV